ncbi:MAG: hypothetical protein ABSF64_15425 [Bryobacteraceae bacterium]|jgi:hypothetical protein
MTDEEITRRSDATQHEMNRRFDATQDEMNRRFDATAHLIQQVAARLEAHIDQTYGDLKARFDRQDARLERHGGLLQGGARATTRLIEWSESADKLWAERDERLRRMEERIRRLEEKS